MREPPLTMNEIETAIRDLGETDSVELAQELGVTLDELYAVMSGGGSEQR